MKKDEDNGNSHYAGLQDRIQGLAVELSAKLAWADPELLAIPEATLVEWLQQPELSQYCRAVQLVTRQRQHILPPEQEQLLAQTGEMAMAANNAFTMLNNVDPVSYTHLDVYKRQDRRNRRLFAHCGDVHVLRSLGLEQLPALLRHHPGAG